MFNWARKKCNCYDNADFRKIDLVGDSIMYRCNNCNRYYYSPEYLPGLIRHNPVMEKYFMKKMFNKMKDTSE